MCYPKALVEGLVRRVPTLEFPVAHVRDKISPAVHLNNISSPIVTWNISYPLIQLCHFPAPSFSWWDTSEFYINLYECMRRRGCCSAAEITKVQDLILCDGRSDTIALLIFCFLDKRQRPTLLLLRLPGLQFGCVVGEVWVLGSLVMRCWDWCCCVLAGLALLSLLLRCVCLPLSDCRARRLLVPCWFGSHSTVFCDTFFSYGFFNGRLSCFFLLYIRLVRDAK